MDPSKEVWTTEKKIALLNAEIERMQLELQNEPSAHLGAVWPFGEWVDSADEVDRFCNDMFFPVIDWLRHTERLDISEIKMGQAGDPIFEDHVDKHIHYTSKSYPPNKILLFKIDPVMIYIFVYINRQKHRLAIVCRELRDDETLSLRRMYKAAFTNNAGVLEYDSNPGDAFRTKLINQAPSLHRYFINQPQQDTHPHNDGEINRNRSSEPSSDTIAQTGRIEYLDPDFHSDLVSTRGSSTRQINSKITVLPKTSSPVSTSAEHEKQNTFEAAELGASFFKSFHSISAREDRFFNDVFFPFIRLVSHKYQISTIKIGSYLNPNFSKFIDERSVSHSSAPNRVITFQFQRQGENFQRSAYLLVYVQFSRKIGLVVQCHEIPRQHISLRSAYNMIVKKPHAYEIQYSTHPTPQAQLYHIFDTQIFGAGLDADPEYV